MIKLTSMNGQEFVLNAELIERVEAVPETLITLTSGKKMLVTETVDQVVARVKEYRRESYGRLEVSAGKPRGEGETWAESTS